MYVVRTPGYSKKDQQMRWRLPDRVFFACGACHILAYAFLKRYGVQGRKVLWLKPAAGFTGNHIFVATGDNVFDYHGYSERRRFLRHSFRRAAHYWPGWQASLMELPMAVLVSGEKSRAHDGLWLRARHEFLNDPLPRAFEFLHRFPAPEAVGFDGKA